MLTGCSALQNHTGGNPVSPSEASAAETQEERDIVVLFTSDVHCGVDQNFGYVGLKAVMDRMKAAGNRVLLVDNGDSIQGEPLGTLTSGCDRKHYRGGCVP